MVKFFSLIFFVIVLLVAWETKELFISYFASKNMGIDVSIGSFKVLSNEIHDFKIKDKTGASALSVRTILTENLIKKLFAQQTTFDQITLDDVHLVVKCADFTCSKNNWSELAKSIKSHGESKVYVKKIVFKNFIVDVEEAGIMKRKKHLVFPRLVVENISGKGFPTQEIIVAIFKNAGIEDYLKDFLTPTNFLQKFFTPFNK